MWSRQQRVLVLAQTSSLSSTSTSKAQKVKTGEKRKSVGGGSAVTTLEIFSWRAISRRVTFHKVLQNPFFSPRSHQHSFGVVMSEARAR